MKKLLLIDGHNLLFKMFYGMPFQFYSDNGANITGTVGFIGAILKLVKQFNIDDCLVVFDGENSLVRASIDEEYKANRVIDYSVLPDEENPFTQLEIIKKTLDALSIKWFETVNAEVDDYIACISKRYNGDVYIVSTDQDFIQLIRNNVFVVNYKGSKSKIIDSNAVIEKYGISPDDFVLLKALMGDKSDNITGIRGVGPKTALKIIASIKNGENNKFIKIYEDNYLLIEKNINLVKLPYFEFNFKPLEVEDYKIFREKLKDIKVLSFVNSVIT